MSGVIEGGWGFVTAAYVVTAAVLAGYGASVFLRYKAIPSPKRETPP